MSKAEKFIQEYTRNCSNLLYRDYTGGFDKTAYHPWLTPDQARRVAEIAREETIKEVCEWLNNNKEEYQYKAPYNYFDMGQCTEDLKKYFNIEQEDKYMIFTIGFSVGFFILGSFFGLIISIIAFSLVSMNRLDEEE